MVIRRFFHFVYANVYPTNDWHCADKTTFACFDVRMVSLATYSVVYKFGRKGTTFLYAMQMIFNYLRKNSKIGGHLAVNRNNIFLRYFFKICF